MLKWTKKYSILLMVSLIAVLISACGMPKTTEQPTPEKAKVEQPAPDAATKTDETKTTAPESKGKTIELVTLQYPPYEYDENGVVKGIAVDIVKEGFKRMGYETKIQLLPWARALDMIKSGEADGIFTAYKTPEREAFADYSNEVLMPQVVSLFVKKDSTIVFDGDLEKLSKYKIGTVRGVSYGEKFDKLAKEKKLNIEEADSGENNMDKLLNGRFDILISNKYGALSILKKLQKNDAVKELTPEVQSVPSYIAFSKARNLSGMRDEFDKMLLEMSKDGTIEKYINAYIQ